LNGGLLSISKVFIRKKCFLADSPGLFFKNLHRYWQNIRPLVCHEVSIVHDVNKVFQIAPGKIGQPFIPSSEYQNIEPLDEKADECKDSVDPENNTDNYPVSYTDKEFKTAGVLLKRKELF